MKHLWREGERRGARATVMVEEAEYKKIDKDGDKKRKK